MNYRAELIGKLAAVVHELGKVVLVVTIFLALYQGGMLAYLLYVDKMPFAEARTTIQTGSFLLDYGVAVGIALFIAIKIGQRALVKQLPR
ncbi:hypothetical protein [Rhodopila globiformis]|nr:hypothetical protein [Rhodopila globiformis]